MDHRPADDAFLAALQQIPGELYEAAALDNAGRWRSFRFITLPSIRRTMLVVVIYEIVAQFQLFGQAWLLTKGGPNNASRPIVLFIYEQGFKSWNLGSQRPRRRSCSCSWPGRHDCALRRLPQARGGLTAMAAAGHIVGRTLGNRLILGAVVLLAIVWMMPIAWVVILSSSRTRS